MAGLLLCLYSVFYSVCFFGSLAVIKAVKRAYEIAGDAANTLERNGFPVIGEVDKIAVNLYVDSVYALVGIFFARPFYVSGYLLVGKGAACYVNMHIGHNITLHI